MFPIYVGIATHQNLIEEILDELLLERSGGEEAVKIGSEQLGDKVADLISRCRNAVGSECLHVLQWRDEDVAQTNDLPGVSIVYQGGFPGWLTFSCRRCLRSFSSRYVRLDRTGVLKGFMIFLIATAWLVS